MHPVAGLLQGGHRAFGLGGDLGGVGRAGTQDELDIGIEVVRRGDQVPDALLPGDAAHEHDDRAVRIETDSGDDGLVARLGRTRMPDGGVDPVAHHVDPSRIDEGVGVEHVEAHPVADRDDRVGVPDGVAFGPGGDAVTAAELLGLPRPSRLEGVRGEDVRDIVEFGGEMTGQPGVPGVRVHHVDSGRGVRHAQPGGQGRQGGIGVAQCRVGGVHERGVARCTRAVHVDLDQSTQLFDEFGDVDSGPAVHLRRIFPRHHCHPHRLKVAGRAGSGHPAPTLRSASRFRFAGGGLGRGIG